MGVIVLFVFYMLIVFARIKANQGIVSLLRNKAQKRDSSRPRYYSLAGDSQQADENEAAINRKLSTNQNGTIVNLERDSYDDGNDDDTDDEVKSFVVSNHQKNSEIEEIQTKLYNGLLLFNSCFFLPQTPKLYSF